MVRILQETTDAFSSVGDGTNFVVLDADNYVLFIGA